MKRSGDDTFNKAAVALNVEATLFDTYLSSLNSLLICTVFIFIFAEKWKYKELVVIINTNKSPNG